MDDRDDLNTEKKSVKTLMILVGILAVCLLVLLITIYPQELHNLKKFSKADLSSVSVDVSNSLPESSGASLNGGNTINLTENTTTSITATGTVTDYNSCKDLASVSIAVFKDGTTCATSGDANNDTCYFWTDSSPASDSSCTGDSDVSYSASHNFSIQYYTDGGTWKAAVLASDIVGAGTPDTSTGVTLNDLQSLNVGDIAYGSVAPGGNSSGDHTATVTNTGNTALDFKISGTDLTCATRGSIPVANQQYALSSFTYGTGTALSDTSTDVNANLPAPAQATVPVNDTSYWQIAIPNGTKGTCSGSTTFTAQAAI